MRIHSYTITHYGKSYIGYALKSIRPEVTMSHVIYTSSPTHGHSTDKPPVESKQEILQAAYSLQRDLKWYNLNSVFQEGEQRDAAVDLCRKKGADLVLVVDYDEIWDPNTLQAALNYVWKENSSRNWLINFTHLWRSFNWACRDDGWPVRIIDLRHEGGTGYIPREFGEIYHFGYAITDKVMRYKWEIHGHKSELRPNWFDEKWNVWPPPGDCHPTNDKGFWNPEPFDKTILPKIMKSHPFYNLEIIA